MLCNNYLKYTNLFKLIILKIYNNLRINFLLIIYIINSTIVIFINRIIYYYP